MEDYMQIDTNGRPLEATRLLLSANFLRGANVSRVDL
jgi:hypothetical protein